MRLLQADPYFTKSAESRFAEGKSLEAQGRFSEAETIYREVAASFERRRYNAGTPYAALGFALIGQGRWDDAEKILKKSVKLEPKLLEANINLGAVYRNTRRWKECETYSKLALEIEPKDTRARINLGVALGEMQQYGPAVQSFLLILALDPDHLEARKGIASNYVQLGETAVSIPMFRKIIEMEPECLTNYSQILFAMQYDPTLSNEAVLDDHLAFGQKTRSLIGPPRDKFTNSRDTARVLKIGYVSGDFKTHVVMRFVEKVLASHDRTKFEIVCIATNSTQDSTTERIKKIADQWVDISATDDETASNQIRDLELDIAVDLCGHSSILRLPLFARRLAPIHVTWCGYSGTTGLDTMDYIVVDDVLAPPGEKTYFAEEPLRMPGAYVCFNPSDNSPDIGPLPFEKNGHITFGCMNNPSKVNKYVIGWWAQILKAVPNSRLLMRYHLLGDLLVKERLLKIFRSLEIDDRVDMRTGGGNLLDAYNQVDIALDTFPYNGTTTTCEALWMGVPVVTIRGDRFVARVGASLLTNTGLGNLVADSPESYVDLAVQLASKPEELAETRKGMRAHLQTTEVYDSERFTKGLETAYLNIFEKWAEQ